MLSSEVKESPFNQALQLAQQWRAQPQHSPSSSSPLHRSSIYSESLSRPNPPRKTQAVSAGSLYHGLDLQGLVQQLMTEAFSREEELATLKSDFESVTVEKADLVNQLDILAAAVCQAAELRPVGQAPAPIELTELTGSETVPDHTNKAGVEVAAALELKSSSHWEPEEPAQGDESIGERTEEGAGASLHVSRRCTSGQRSDTVEPHPFDGFVATPVAPSDAAATAGSAAAAGLGSTEVEDNVEDNVEEPELEEVGVEEQELEEEEEEEDWRAVRSEMEAQLHRQHAQMSSLRFARAEAEAEAKRLREMSVDGMAMLRQLEEAHQTIRELQGELQRVGPTCAAAAAEVEEIQGVVHQREMDMRRLEGALNATREGREHAAAAQLASDEKLQAAQVELTQVKAEIGTAEEARRQAEVQQLSHHFREESAEADKQELMRQVAALQAKFLEEEAMRIQFEVQLEGKTREMEEMKKELQSCTWRIVEAQQRELGLQKQVESALAEGTGDGLEQSEREKQLEMRLQVVRASSAADAEELRNEKKVLMQQLKELQEQCDAQKGKEPSSQAARMRPASGQDEAAAEVNQLLARLEGAMELESVLRIQVADKEKELEKLKQELCAEKEKSGTLAASVVIATSDKDRLSQELSCQLASLGACEDIRRDLQQKLYLAEKEVQEVKRSRERVCVMLEEAQLDAERLAQAGSAENGRAAEVAAELRAGKAAVEKEKERLAGELLQLRKKVEDGKWAVTAVEMEAAASRASDKKHQEELMNARLKEMEEQWQKTEMSANWARGEVTRLDKLLKDTREAKEAHIREAEVLRVENARLLALSEKAQWEAAAKTGELETLEKAARAAVASADQAHRENQEAKAQQFILHAAELDRAQQAVDRLEMESAHKDRRIEEKALLLRDALAQNMDLTETLHRLRPEEPGGAFADAPRSAEDERAFHQARWINLEVKHQELARAMQTLKEEHQDALEKVRGELLAKETELINVGRIRRGFEDERRHLQGLLDDTGAERDALKEEIRRLEEERPFSSADLESALESARIQLEGVGTLRVEEALKTAEAGAAAREAALQGQLEAAKRADELHMQEAQRERDARQRLATRLEQSDRARGSLLEELASVQRQLDQREKCESDALAQQVHELKQELHQAAEKKLSMNAELGKLRVELYNLKNPVQKEPW